MKFHAGATLVCFTLSLFAVSACDGPQSAFGAAGEEARRTALLSWIMFAGASLIFAIVFIMTALAIFGPVRWKKRLRRHGLVAIGGVAFPAVILSALLIYGFSVLGAGAAYLDEENPFRVSVVGEQWWWRVIYKHEDGTHTESANELRVPVGRVVEVDLTSADVIHSFWIPSYAGKLDMVPGRTNTLRFVADKPGAVRGQCAEYCGGAHAWMAFFAIAMEPDAFETWLANERNDASAAAPADGETLFIASGCGACHRIRGAAARGEIGPDLTHVGARRSLGAGVLPNDEDAFAQWIANHQDIKPDTHMPPFEFFTKEELATLADYLDSLE